MVSDNGPGDATSGASATIREPLRGEGMKPENSDLRRDVGGTCIVELEQEALPIGGGITFISVTNLLKFAIARKQNFAGVVNRKSTGRTWGAPAPHQLQVIPGVRSRITIIDL